MPYRDQIRAHKTKQRYATIARISVMLALANALFLLRAMPMVSPPDDPFTTFLTWDCVLFFCLAGLMIMAAAKRYRP